MIRPIDPTDEAVARAAARLRGGDVVAFPTETVYGLGADTFNPVALHLIYELKQRPPDNPLIAHVLDETQARRVAAFWTDLASALAARFWPGPLTLVVPRGPDVPDGATAGLPTIAVRCPAHDVARRLLDAFDGPISAPSANRSGHVSPTAARHVAEDFADVHDLLILDGGPCRVGIESTVLDLTVGPPRVLRPGSVSASELREVLGDLRAAEVTGQDASPGTSPRHYAPRTPAEMVPSEHLLERLKSLHEPAVVLSFASAFVPRPHEPIVMPEAAGSYAQELYDALRRADALERARIIIQEPPRSNDLWQAIHNRLRRATGSAGAD
ncbi:MAG: L-threonylcarbamoyladenylate synthase [Planctomycetota bacterium]